MSYNGSGTFQINSAGQPVVSGTTITSTAFNLLTADLATGLSTAICKDGQTTTTAEIPFAAGIAMTGTASNIELGSNFISNGGTDAGLSLDGSNNATLSGTLTLTGGQLVFPATQSASTNANTLDDYEEGTWTPVLTFATAGDLSVVYSAQNARYQKVGKWVHVACTITTSTFTHTTASGNLQVTGLPFTSVNVSNNFFHGALSWGGITKATYTNIVSRLDGNSTTVQFVASGSGVALAFVTATDCPTAGTMSIRFGFSFEATA